MANPKRNVEIYREHKQGVKTGVLIKTYNLSRQRLHQIFKQEKIKEENLKEENLKTILEKEENLKTILEKEEKFNKMKEAKLCGTCCFYDSNGFCDNVKSLDSCADRDSDRTCDNGQYKYKN